MDGAGIGGRRAGDTGEEEAVQQVEAPGPVIGLVQALGQAAEARSEDRIELDRAIGEVRCSGSPSSR